MEDTADTESDALMVVFVTFPSEEKARQIGTLLVKRQLIACINILPGVSSIYTWDGKICEDRECLGILKTGAGKFGELKAAVNELHPYDVPEIVAVEADKVDEKYLDWVLGK